MTITDLVTNFRTALQGLVPCFERAEIPWNRPESYDEWDNCASAIFQALIVEPLRSARPEGEREGFRLPGYDMLQPTYTGLSVIEIRPASSDGAMKVFHALGTSSTPFDIVEFRSVSPDGLPLSEKLLTIPLGSARFVTRIWANGVLADTVEEV
jgi:hypothetical protein